MAKISELLSIITKTLNTYRTPPPKIPNALLLTGSKLRPGLSPTLITSKIISRQNEAGAPIGTLPSGSENISEKMELIRVEEIINAILLDARIDVAIEPGIAVQTNGVSPVGPVTSVGSTVSIGVGSGIIR